MSFAGWSFKIFIQSTRDYHILDDVEAEMHNPYDNGTIAALLYAKNWIDTVQWHLEDMIRDPEIDATLALTVKRRIDRLNQERTHLVESIDEYYAETYRNVKVLPQATFNTESPAWALDRLSILELKLFHVEQEIVREDVSEEHIVRCKECLRILSGQKNDLIAAIDQLLDDIQAGRKHMKVYKQLKMYNDPTMNPVLYRKREKKSCSQRF